jgi:hypothetical protein
MSGLEIVLRTSDLLQKELLYHFDSIASTKKYSDD